VQTPTAAKGSTCDNLRFALDLLAPHGVVVLIEPINSADLPGYFMHTVALARQVIAGIGYRHLKLLFDVYHLAKSGLDPVQAFRDSRRDIGHVQLADHPGRHEPDTGTIDFAALLQAAAETDYRGWFSAEYLPLGTTEAGLGWLDALQARHAQAKVREGQR
jgi:hydroxypyruvate isomerase